MKFKVGDKVRIKDSARPGVFYGTVLFLNCMNALKGRTLTVKAVYSSIGAYKLSEYSDSYFSEGMLEPAEAQQQVVIYANGDTTTAIIKQGGKVVKRAFAKRNPIDTYDFSIGAKLALDRLFESDNKISGALKVESNNEKETKTKARRNNNLSAMRKKAVEDLINEIFLTGRLW